MRPDVAVGRYIGMHLPRLVRFVGLTLLLSPVAVTAADGWPQWRGPNRDGIVAGQAWPRRIGEAEIKTLWRAPLGPGYSGPIVSDQAVFVTETLDKKTEVVRALDRRTGAELWRHSWAGAISVPFYAKSRGDWIRATPAFDGETLFVAGMRDVLVALDGATGNERWRIDFVKAYGTSVPDFGLVCSPLPDGDSVYLQAANSVVRIRKSDGQVLWRSFEGKSGVMSEGCFSSPVIATIRGERQLVVQSREKLAGLALADGRVLWSQSVPSFRGMNILTPTVVGDAVFTSSYQNKSWLYSISREGETWRVTESWTGTAQGYMSSPIVIDGHAYLHLANGRFTCVNLANGERTWTSDAFGKYVSLVAQGNRILGLDERGILVLVEADPKEFRLIGQHKVAETETWAHLAISGDEIFVRELKAMSVFRWTERPAERVASAVSP